MTDLEIRQWCARAMKFEQIVSNGSEVYVGPAHAYLWLSRYEYNPFNDDAQAMALVKKFGPTLNMMIGYFDSEWVCNVGIDQPAVETHHPTDLNRAICECIAKMQASR